MLGSKQHAHPDLIPKPKPVYCEKKSTQGNERRSRTAAARRRQQQAAAAAEPLQRGRNERPNEDTHMRTHIHIHITRPQELVGGWRDGAGQVLDGRLSW